jgi:hypothetical protein
MRPAFEPRTTSRNRAMAAAADPGQHTYMESGLPNIRSKPAPPTKKEEAAPRCLAPISLFPLTSEAIDRSMVIRASDPAQPNLEPDQNVCVRRRDGGRGPTSSVLIIIDQKSPARGGRRSEIVSLPFFHAHLLGFAPFFPRKDRTGETRREGGGVESRVSQAHLLFCSILFKPSSFVWLFVCVCLIHTTSCPPNQWSSFCGG